MNVKQKFRQSLRCGTGEAYLILRENPDIDFSKDIEKAALTNWAYDPQSEGNRADYVARLILSSSKVDLLKAKVSLALLNERSDYHVLDQLFAIAGIFAKQGDRVSRDTIYKRFQKKVIPGSESAGQEQIVELDGMDGMLYVAEQRGKALLANPNDCEHGWFVESFQEDHPNIAVQRELKKAAKTNPSIKKYLDEIKPSRSASSGPPSRPKFTYEIVSKNIDLNRVIPVPPAGIKELSKRDLTKLANDFVAETVPIRQEKYLRIFARRKYPFGYKQILNIAMGVNSRDNRLVEYACETLKYFSGPDIRKFAVQKLAKTNSPSDYLHLLVSNYKKGDYKLLASVINRFKSEHVIHSMIWGLVAIYEANKTKECKEPLELMYSKLTCGIHRFDIVRILNDNNVLSKKILSEMEYDSYDSIRELYIELKKKR